MYLGIDISNEQIKEANERAKENRFLNRYQFLLGDVGDPDCCKQLEQQSNKFKHHHSYDLGWCMFAFHYFCDTETHCRNFFSTVSYLLKPKGKLIMTFPSPYAIYNELIKIKEENLDESEPPLCSIKYLPKENEELFNKTIDNCLESFGISYSFTLGDAVQVRLFYHLFF